eukprot:3547361-Rhodomonas_salina.1
MAEITADFAVAPQPGMLRNQSREATAPEYDVRRCFERVNASTVTFVLGETSILLLKFLFVASLAGLPITLLVLLSAPLCPTLPPQTL